MARLIRFTWVSSLIFFVLIKLLQVIFNIEHGPEGLSYYKDRCTYYCETYGCQHRHLLGQYHYLMEWQVNGLHQMGGSYQKANNLIYWYGIGGFWLVSALYLSSLGKARYLVVEFMLALLFGALALSDSWPNNVESLFQASVFFCLYLSRVTGYSLYDVYMIIFGFGIPLVTLGFVLLVSIKSIRNNSAVGDGRIHFRT